MTENKAVGNFPKIEKDLVSVIVPCYNVEKWLGDCFKSIKAQTYKNFEVVFTDDGSTDKTPQILDDFCNENVNAYVIHQKNAWAGAARNVALARARGEYVFFLDSDDFIHPKTLELCVEALKSTNADFAYFDVNYLIGNKKANPNCAEKCMKKPSEKEVNKAKNFVLSGQEKLMCEYFSRHLTLAVWNKMYRHEIFRKIECYPKLINEECRYGEDLEFNYIHLLQTKTAVHIPLKLYYYRKPKNSALRSKFKPAQITVFDGFERIKKIDQSVYPNTMVYIKSLEATVSFEILQRMSKSKEFLDIEAVEKVYDLYNSGIKSVRKGRKNPFYIKFLPFLKPFAYFIIQKKRRKTKQQNARNK